MPPTESRDALVEQLTAAHEELQRLHDRGDGAGFDKLVPHARSLVRRLEGVDAMSAEQLRMRQAIVDKIHGGGRVFDGEHGSPGDTTMTTTRNLNIPAGADGAPIERAARRLDELHRDGLPDHAAERVEGLLTDGPMVARSTTARWVDAAGSDEYAAAFAKLCADPQRGDRLWTDDERQAYQRAQVWLSETRAMGTGAGAGGELIPLTLDPAIMLTSDGSTNPLRRISRVVQTSTNLWQGVTSAGTFSAWKPEHQQATDSSFTLDPAPIPVHMASSFVPFSFEVGMDAIDFSRQLGLVLLDAADQLQAEAFVTGSGNGQPTGFVTALAASTNPNVTVWTTTNNVVGSPDVYATQNALPPRFQPGARWAGNLATLNHLSQEETGNGAKVFSELENDRMLRRPVHEVSFMSDAITTTNAAVLAYGDFARGYIIADRIGSTFELIPHLFGANQRPTLQRGAVLWFRTGADVVIPNAFRLLTVTG